MITNNSGYPPASEKARRGRSGQNQTYGKRSAGLGSGQHAREFTPKYDSTLAGKSFKNRGRLCHPTFQRTFGRADLPVDWISGGTPLNAISGSK
jgi:hypothetical protein